MDWVRDYIVWLRSRGGTAIEPTAAAQSGWMEHVSEVADATLFPRADFWYVGANIPGKPQVFHLVCGRMRTVPR